MIFHVVDATCLCFTIIVYTVYHMNMLNINFKLNSISTGEEKRIWIVYNSNNRIFGYTYIEHEIEHEDIRAFIIDILIMEILL